MIRHDVRLYPLIGEYAGPNGVEKVVWKDLEVLHLDGREIAKIKAAPGAPIGILNGFALTESEQQAVMEAVAAARGGVPPSAIHCPTLLYEKLDGGDEAETEIDDD